MGENGVYIRCDSPTNAHGTALAYAVALDAYGGDGCDTVLDCDPIIARKQ